MQLNYPEYRVRESDGVTVWMVQRFCTRLISRVLLVAYALLMFKPAMPVIADAMAHTFWKSAHMKVVHRVNGKEHVHYELCKAAKEGEKQKSTGKWKYEHSDEANIVIATPNAFAAPAFCVQVYSDVLQVFPEAYTDPDFLPPKA